MVGLGKSVECHRQIARVRFFTWCFISSHFPFLMVFCTMYFIRDGEECEVRDVWSELLYIK